MAYLDHAATTPMLPAAIAATTAELGRVGNPSSLHTPGRAARRVVEESREALAEGVGARPGEVVFTSGGTEADNLAVKGLYWSRVAADGRRRRVLVGAGEHHAVLDAAAWLSREQGAQVEPLPLDAVGRVRLDALAESLARDPGDVALVSVLWANNEVGTIQPVAEIVELAHAYGIPVHSDAVQAAGQLDVRFATSGLDALTLTGHKIGGPVGAGALVLRRDADVTPVLHGGGQERDVRSGTLDAAAYAGFAAALTEVVAGRADEAVRLAGLRDELVRRVLDAVPDAELNGDPDPAGRLPGNAHFSFPGCEGDSLLLLLDARDVFCSTGSACSAGVAEPSHVLLAMGASEERARGSLRFSLGHTSTEADVDALAEAIGPAVERASRAGVAAHRVS
ncbi:MAG: cysteine desulfurase [Streptosporangiales bacterium]|nr:cysteine desulfurase [Streptosporangiales bacterium]